MPGAMGQISKVVLLMLENRSLDNVLGWLHEDTELPADRIYPAGSSQRFEGLNGSQCNFVGIKPHRPAHGTQDYEQPLRQPRWNPNEWWANTGNQMYQDGEGRNVVPRWDPVANPPMSGFAHDYEAWYDATNEVMGAYSEIELPVLYGLAKNFAVSDRWFSSVPTETNPNRAFSICGTSCGAVDNADRTTYPARTLFDMLNEADTPRPKSWGVYYEYNGFFDMDPTEPGTCYTVDVFPRIAEAISANRGTVGTLDDFLTSLAAGTQPDVSYIEPFWSGGYGLPTGDDFIGLSGNDYHSPAWIGRAEYDLNELYKAIRRSPLWEETLLIISFDEHGGTYDHVAPPKTVRPDDSPSIQPFSFDRLGVRVPTILVSPHVRPGSIFRAPTNSEYDFDHTSIIATLARWVGRDPATVDLGLRVASAPTFEDLIVDEIFDAPTSFPVPNYYKDLGGEKGPHNIPFGDKLSLAHLKHLLDLSTDAEHFLQLVRDAL